MKRVLASLAFVVVAGCPKKSIVIYRSLSQPGAFDSCDANKQFRIEAEGKTEADARANGEAKARSYVESNHGCGAFVINDGAGSKLDGGYSYAGNFQWCACK